MTQPPVLNPDDWVTIRVLATATGNNVTAIYAALYDRDNPMPCARRGRSIRVRLADWRAWWSHMGTTIEPGSPTRAPRRVKAVTP
ncbi:MAG: hypothetical protein M3619_04500 [Myxococcota bacterium]|nr:hypothetical protein [Myxococcota bacterium]